MCGTRCAMPPMAPARPSALHPRECGCAGWTAPASDGGTRRAGPPGRALTSAHALLVQSPLESQRRATQMQTLSMNLTVLQRMDPSVVSLAQPASCFSASASKSVRLACAAPHA
jgi:hypothetical protein